MFPLHAQVSVATSVRHNAQAAAANGSGVDLQGYHDALAVLDVIALGGTTPTATYVLQESDDDVTYANVATADMLGGAQPAAFSAAGFAIRGYKGAKRYLRWRLDALGGTGPTSTASGTIARGRPRHAPAGVTQAP